LRFFAQALIAYLALGCSSKDVPLEHVCSANQREIYSLLREFIGSGDTFPKSLGELSGIATNSTLFVCPATSRKPGEMTNVNEWTDYIYLGNLPEIFSIDVPVLICPPENHGGKVAIACFIDGRIRHISKEEIAAYLEKKPEMEVTVKGGTKMVPITDVTINVPVRYQTVYLRKK
jgi:hypothetical protein